MSTPPTSWFHCGHCGTLFRAEIGPHRTCQSCGKNPSLGLAPVKSSPANQPTPAAQTPPATREPERRRSTRKKSGAPMLVLITAWSVATLVIILSVNHFWKSGGRGDASRRPITTPDQLTATERILLENNATTCQQLLISVLSNNSPETLSPFVFNNVESLTDIIRFYQENSTFQASQLALQSTGMSIVRLPEGPAIEGRWKSEDNRSFDAVFRLDNDQWRLDWHHFIRYSDFPFQRFLLGEGPDECEFRLLARQRLTRVVLDDPEETLTRPISIAFHAPRVGHPHDYGPPSPEFLVERDTETARILLAGFAQSRENRLPFQALQLPPAEPNPDMLRVRVLIRRTPAENGHTFELREIRALHWLNHNHLGLPPDPQEQPPD